MNTITMLSTLKQDSTTLKAIRISDHLTVYYDSNMNLINAATANTISLNINHTDKWTLEPRNAIQTDFMSAFDAWYNNGKNARVFINGTLQQVYKSDQIEDGTAAIGTDYILLGTWYIDN